MDSFSTYYAHQARTGVGCPQSQIGHGLGNWISTLFKNIFPYLKSGFNAVKDEAIKGGIGLLSDTVNQVPIKESLQRRLQGFGEGLTTRAVNKVNNMKGGKVYKRKRKTKTQQSGGKRKKGKSKSVSKKRKKTAKCSKKKVKRLGKGAKKPKSKKKGKKRTKKNILRPVDIFG